MLIKVSGATPETRLELSPNLVNWGPVEAPMLEEGTFAVPKNNSPGRRFFRTVR
jgi:hypothetical protein